MISLKQRRDIRRLKRPRFLRLANGTVRGKVGKLSELNFVTS